MRFAIPAAGESLVSTWDPLLNSIWAHQLDMADVQALGVGCADERGMSQGPLPVWS
ncbi:hypothetical protein [Brevundimonas sp.]|uniref:hypothetical protein n=1 Tax=Brevundimonas sp. TaxID=1871086 RepID=UPI00286D0B23|nr:hypothetical protein [Brevundimonas sp.]